MGEKKTNENLLADARERTERLAASLPDRIQIAALTLKSKLPFKAVSLRELLIHRMCELSTANVEQFDAERAIPAALLTRATMETFALLYALHIRLDAFLKRPDIHKADKLFMTSLMGSRSDPGLPKAEQILNLVDLVNETIPKFRANYDMLSERAHPNWAGVLGSFGTIDKEAFELLLGPRKDTTWKYSSLNVFTATLIGFEIYYNRLTDQLYAFNDFFERAPPE